MKKINSIPSKTSTPLESKFVIGVVIEQTCIFILYITSVNPNKLNSFIWVVDNKYKGSVCCRYNFATTENLGACINSR